MKTELRHITKAYGSVVANDGIDLTIDAGEIHCVLGENGAGKSTLMNILFGVTRPDEGQIVIDEQVQSFRSPADAISARIGMVHQHFTLVPALTVAENVMLGVERTKALGWLDRERARSDVLTMAKRYGLDAPHDVNVETLPVGIQQRVEIMKALRRDAHLLILDEPTAVLTPQESEQLFGIMRSLRESGRSVIFISHKLREVRPVADRITVIRRGKVVGTAGPDATNDELASLMVGRAIRLGVRKTLAEPTAPVLVTRSLRVDEGDGRQVLDDLSLEVRRREILAVAGVQGNGQTELAETLLGLRTPSSGTIVLNGRDITRLDTRRRIQAGIGYIPEDRRAAGLVAAFSIAENLVLNVYDTTGFSNGLRLKRNVIAQHAERLIEEFDIRTRSANQPADALSGGNQQKVLLARELSRPLSLLIAAEPTRGLDIAAAEYVQERIILARDEGTAVLLVSSDLDEVTALGDRIAVMYRGAIFAVVPPDIPRKELGLLMAGIPIDGAQAVQR
jgi:ABC-type uncharacterized transport system ATPase subunit